MGLTQGATEPGSRRPTALLGLALWAASVLLFVVAVSVGDVIDRSNRAAPNPSYSYATWLLPLYAGFAYTPMLAASAVLAIRSISDRNSRVLSIVTLSLALLSLIPAVPLLLLTLSFASR